MRWVNHLVLRLKNVTTSLYQEDIKVYEVFGADGSSLGLFYADYFARDSKRGGA